MRSRIVAAAARHGVHLGHELAGGTTNRCFAATDQWGGALVLKVCADPSTALPEAEALRLWGSQVAVSVVGVDGPTGSISLERLTPGEAMVAGDDPAVDARSAGASLARLHQQSTPHAATAHLPLREMMQRRVNLAACENLLSACPEAREDALIAVAMLADLLVTQDAPVLLHGDAISKNLLRSAHGLRWIDPMPCAGDPLADLAMWASHHHPGGDTDTLLDTLADQRGVDLSRLRRWAFVVTALEYAARGSALSCERGQRHTAQLTGWRRGERAQTSPPAAWGGQLPVR